MIRLVIITIVLMMASGVASQALNGSDTPVKGSYYANEQLADAAKERAAFDLMLKLRCIQCQGQSIADSDAPIAQAMRHQVRLQIEQGKTENEIKGWMIARYGDYVSFDPSLSGIAIILWAAPALFFLLALYLVIPLFRGQNIDQNDKEIK